MAEALRSQTISRGKAYDAVSPWLSERRITAQEKLENLIFPTRKTEAWKYTDVSPLLSREQSAETSVNNRAHLDAACIDSYAAHRVVVSDGVYQPQHSQLDALPEGVIVSAFSELDSAGQQLVLNWVGEQANSEERIFTVLNEVAMHEGVLVFVPKKTQLDKPVHVVFDTQSGDHELRLLVILEEGAEAALVEHHTGAQKANGLTNIVSEYYVGRFAGLQHYRLGLVPKDSHQVHAGYVDQRRYSRYNALSLSLGSALHRHDWQISLSGPGAEANLGGAYMAADGGHVDTQLSVEHLVPHCNSTETFRGLAGDKGRCIFNGRIHIYPDAQKTSAMLDNKNLLMSKSAEINAKPELEIYADDVKCAHGSTMGQLDEKAVFYLRSRGVDEAAARAMLAYGFVNEQVMSIEDDALRGYLEQQLRSFFEGMKHE